MTDAREFEVVTVEQLATCVDDTVAELFRWTCRIAGPDAARDILPRVYADVTSLSPDSPRVTLDDLRAATLRLAQRSEHEVDPDPVARALLQLHGVEHRPLADTARVVGLDTDAVVDACATAERTWRAGQADSTLDEFLRRDEAWLDDQLLEQCRSVVRRRDDVAPDESGARRSTRRHTRGMALIVVSVAALIVAAAVVWIGTGDANDVSGALPLPSSTTTVAAATSTTAAAPIFLQAPGYILDHTTEAITPVSAEEFPPPRTSVHESQGWFELWAEAGSTRTDGRWFAAVTSRCDGSAALLEPDAVRLLIGGRGGLLTTAADGVLRIVLAPGNTSLTNRSLEITGHGFTQAEFEVLAGSFVLDVVQDDPTEPPPPNCGQLGIPSGITHDVSFASLTTGLQQLVSAPSRGATASAQMDPVAYRTAVYVVDDNEIDVTTRRRDPDLTTLSRYLDQDATGPSVPLSPDRTINLGGRTVTVSRSGRFATNDAAQPVAIRFDDRDDTVTLTAEVTPSQSLDSLIRLAATARLATYDEWQTLHDTPEHVLAAADATLYQTSTEPLVFQDLATATTTSGATWTLMGISSVGFFQLQDPGTGASFGVNLDVSKPVQEFDTPATAAFVITVADPAPRSTVRVTVNGTVLASSPLVTVDGNGVALLAIDELGPITIELIVPDGTATTLR